MAVIQRGMDERLHIGAQVCVVLKEQVVAEVALGEARPGVAMTGDVLMRWLSAGKPVTAVAIAQLWEQGKLALDDPVARHVPEFAVNGKEAVTIRHLLTHTAGMRAAVWSEENWDKAVARVCAARLEAGWVPGQKAGYDATGGWMVLGEIVRRTSGLAIEQYVRRHIFEPIGMRDTHLALSAEEYAAYGERIGILYNTEDANRMRPNPWDDVQHAAIVRPGASMRGPVRELARFYGMLLARGATAGDGRVLSAQAVEAITARHRTGMYDQTFKHVMDWGLGFLVNSAMYGEATVPYGYGPYASARTFGHGGAQSSTGFCDPERGLVVAVLLNGTPGEARHQERMRALVTAIYEDLELTD
jgi:CubicO group peptidase (beta-lactamase class C family)